MEQLDTQRKKLYTIIVLIPYQEQSGYYNKVENRRALTPRFCEALSLIGHHLTGTEE